MQVTSPLLPLKSLNDGKQTKSFQPSKNGGNLGAGVAYTWLGRQTHNLEMLGAKRLKTRSHGLESRSRHHIFASWLRLLSSLENSSKPFVKSPFRSSRTRAAEVVLLLLSKKNNNTVLPPTVVVLLTGN